MIKVIVLTVMSQNPEKEKALTPEDVIIEAGNAYNHIKFSILKRDTLKKKDNNPSSVFTTMGDQIREFPEKGLRFIFTQESTDITWTEASKEFHPHSFDYKPQPFNDTETEKDESDRRTKEVHSLTRNKDSHSLYHKYTITLERNDSDEPGHTTFKRMRIFIDDNGEGRPVITEPDPKYIAHDGDYLSEVLKKGNVSKLTIPVDPIRYPGIMNTLKFIQTR